MMRLAFVAGILIALVGCTNYGPEAAQLRTACNSGDKASCIDYQTLTITCMAPRGIIQVVECKNVGPASPTH